MWLNKSLARVTIASLAFLASTSVAPTFASDTSPSTTHLVIIQGTVKSINGEKATIQTPDIRPVCVPGEACPQFIIAGTSFDVNTSKAVFEASNGNVVSGNLSVGEFVIVAGKLDSVVSPAGNKILNAKVIEEVVQSPTSNP